MYSSSDGFTFCISIHAPTRGATCLDFAVAVCDSKFQSTLPREERPLWMELQAQTDIFQSTLPREERRYRECMWHLKSYFNPRSHERSDGAEEAVEIQEDISIHAPTRGATNKCGGSNTTIEFQSTLPREERHSCRSCKSCILSISIHAPTRGATWYS